MLLIAVLLAAVQEAPKPGKPVGDTSTWIRASDQPRYAAGAVRMKVLFTPDGQPDRCDIVATTGSREIERAACSAVKKRFRYEPSLSSTGQPIYRILETPSNFGSKPQDITHIATPAMYALSGGVPGEGLTAGLVVEVDEAGALVTCNGPDPSFAGPACKKVAGMWKPLPEVDSAKKPVRYFREIRVTE